MPQPGPDRMVAEPPTRSHASDDRVSHAMAVGRGWRRRRTRCHGPERTPAPGSVRARRTATTSARPENFAALTSGFAHGTEQRLEAVIERGVTDHDRLDHDAVEVLDVGDELVDVSRKREPLDPTGRHPPYSHRRSSRSWRRASVEISRESSSVPRAERFWMSVSVWSTESWRWAAISARSSDRTRSRRSSIAERTVRSTHGPEDQADADRDDQAGDQTVAQRREREAREHHEADTYEHQDGAAELAEEVARND